MDCTLLDSKSEGNATCLLVRARLLDYVRALPIDYDDFAIQREIVSNAYLDKLPSTLIKLGHVPTIVLVASTARRQSNDQKIRVDKFQILDGLQRTYRIRSFVEAAEFVQKHAKKLVALSKAKRLTANQIVQISNEQIGDIRAIDVLLPLVAKHGASYLDSILEQSQWFEIWTGLTLQKQIEKMLVLNAGHKPVKARHQIELLFLAALPALEKAGAGRIRIVREKQQSATTFSKDRGPGEFHFASLMAALIAFQAGRPITSNSDLISDLQDDDQMLREAAEQFTIEFASQIVETLVDIEAAVMTQHTNLKRDWLGREVVLVGIFAAAGEYRKTSGEPPGAVFKYLVKRLKRTRLNLAEFEETRNIQDLSRVNIGMVNKKAVFRAILDMLNNPQLVRISWARYFEV